MYYETFEKLCKERNVTPAKVSKATGIATSTLTNWKKGEYTPKGEKMKLIADFFGVSVDYLMTGQEKEATAYDAMAEEIIACYGLLDASSKKDAVDYLKFLVYKSKKDSNTQ